MPILEFYYTIGESVYHCRGYAEKGKIKNLKAIHNSSRFNMSGCIPYRRRPPPVRNMRAVLKKASSGTRRVFRSPPCSKQASGVQKEYSVPEIPSYGTGRGFMCTGKGLLVYRLKRRNADQAPGLVILRKTAICMLLLLPLNSCRQLWVATKPLQIAANRHQIATDCSGLPQTTANSAKLSQAARTAAPPIRCQPAPR